MVRTIKVMLASTLFFLMGSFVMASGGNAEVLKKASRFVEALEWTVKVNSKIETFRQHTDLFVEALTSDDSRIVLFLL